MNKRIPKSVGLVLDDSGRFMREWYLYLAGLSGLPVIKAVPYAASVELDWADADEIRVGDLEGDLEITTMTGMVDGVRYLLKISQDETGGRDLTVSAPNVRYLRGVTSIDIDTDPNGVTFIGFHYDADDDKVTVMAVN